MPMGMTCALYKSALLLPSLLKTPSVPVKCAPLFLATTADSYGSRAFWNDFYSNSTDEFSWYSGWDDLHPFVNELFPPDTNASLLIPGVGNDPLLRNMWEAGYRQMVAFDYAEAGVECARTLLPTVDILVADARDLSTTFRNATFAAILEKGTLDSIYLSGEKNKTLAKENLDMAVREFSRVLQPGGLLMSLSAACTHAVNSSLTEVLGGLDDWEVVRNGEFFSTDDGYTSNNLDGTFLVWRKGVQSTAN